MVVVAADGRAVAYDASGHALAQGRSEALAEAFCPGQGGRALKIARNGVHLICSDLGGRVIWRAVADGPIGPVAAGRSGVAVLIGKSLAWFGTPDRD